MKVVFKCGVKNVKKVCLIASGGGHLEQIQQLGIIIEKYECFFVVTKSKATALMKEKKYLVSDLDRHSKISKIVSIFIMFLQQIQIFLKERPDVVITTGAAVAIPMCILCKMSKKKVIYIESYARINSVNKSGKIIYKIADLFIVQWEELLKYYPKAIYGGSIY